MEVELYLNKIQDFFNQYPYSKTIALSFILFLIFIIVRKVILGRIGKKTGSRQEIFLLKKKASAYLFYFFVACVFFLWFTQLQVVFVSLLAVAAAVVIALKELIMCVTGGILIKVSNIFKTGDRIHIDGYRGFVIEKNLLTTKVLEIGPESNSQQTTGDIISIPNSIMLAKSLKNESYFKGYSVKSFVFRVVSLKNVESFEQGILNVAKNFSDSYIEEAKRSISKFCDKEGLIVPSINPKTKVIVEEGKKISILVKLPVKNTEVADIEQLLNRYYLEWAMEYGEVKDS